MISSKNLIEAANKKNLKIDITYTQSIISNFGSIPMKIGIELTPLVWHWFEACCSEDYEGECMMFSHIYSQRTGKSKQRHSLDSERRILKIIQ